MKRRKVFVAVLLLVFAVPLALALAFSLLNRINGTIVSSGEKREYLLYVPKTYDPAAPAPLVVSLHGAALWPAAQKEISGWNRLAEEQGFIVVYPAGAGAGPRVWALQPVGLKADIRFIRDLIDKLEATYNIDRTRIYVNGFSNGGGMAFALSCTAADRIAAVGFVAAAQALPWSWCADRRPIPMIAFHGTADRFVPYGGGPSVASSRPFPSVRTWVAKWARRNECEPRPVESRAAPHVSRIAYRNCAEDAGVVLYTVQGGGHSWPGGRWLPAWIAGPTSREIDATRRMWEFFREHRLGRSAHPG
jgi:polyhydroxybutyrate depolymerase